MQYTDIEQNLAAVTDIFATAFDKVENARIVKSQVNTFGLKLKFPLIVVLSLALIAGIIIMQIAFSQYDVLFIVCEAIIIVALAIIIAVSVPTFIITLKNAACAEVIHYLGGKNRCLLTEVTRGGTKAEWSDASFYFTDKDIELIEGGKKEYQPFLYKKIRGHSRGYALLDSAAIIKNFFEGAEVIYAEDGEYRLSSGFCFKIDYDQLIWFEINGMYSECYEHNFPLYAFMPTSKSYVFRYTFTEVNVANFTIRMPDEIREACAYYFIQPPEIDKVIVPDLKR